MLKGYLAFDISTFVQHYAIICFRGFSRSIADKGIFWEQFLVPHSESNPAIHFSSEKLFTKNATS
jgi:hypothetical protein